MWILLRETFTPSRRRGYVEINRVGGVELHAVAQTQWSLHEDNILKFISAQVALLNPYLVDMGTTG